MNNAHYLKFSNTGCMQAGYFGGCDNIPIVNGSFVGNTVPPKDLEKMVDEIDDLFAEFDAKEGLVSGSLVGKPWWKRKLKAPSMEDIKRELKQAANPKHMVEQFKNVTKQNLIQLKDWGKRILKNPAELLHPPLPRTGNKAIDKEIIERIEKMAKKIDPAWQIGDLVEKHVIDPMLNRKGEKEKEFKVREKSKIEIKRYQDDIRKLDKELESVRQQKRQLNKLLNKASRRQGIYLTQCPSGMKRVSKQTYEDKDFAICATKKRKKVVKKRPSAFRRVMKFKGRRTRGIYLPEINPNNLSFNGESLM